MVTQVGKEIERVFLKSWVFEVIVIIGWIALSTQ